MAGKSAEKKLKQYLYIYIFIYIYMLYFFQTYIFWRAGRGQIGDKKMNKMYVCFFFGWEGRAGCGKIEQICLFFWTAGRGKICGKKIEQIYIYICNII